MGRARDFNCAVDDPKHDKQRAEKQSTSDESLDSATAFGQPVSPRHDLTSAGLFSRTQLESPCSVLNRVVVGASKRVSEHVLRHFGKS